MRFIAVSESKVGWTAPAPTASSLNRIALAMSEAQSAASTAETVLASPSLPVKAMAQSRAGKD